MSPDVDQKSGIPESLLNTLKSNSASFLANAEDDIRKPDGAWNYRGQRQRLGHLIKAPPSHSGQVGTRDISFLHDNPNLGTNGDASIAETIIPQNFHIIKSRKVLGLDAKTGVYKTTLTDAEQRLRVFPSLQPNKRIDAVLLDQTLDILLKEIQSTSTNNGEGHIHNVLDLIKKEQEIYDVVFYEVIRQVTVECKERGQLLSKLRMAYADLLAKIPDQISGMHTELIAQRVLDKKLTSQLLRFKDEIQTLTERLSTVRNHDKEITEEAEKSKGDLRFAMMEAAKNAAILEEYHQLYEMQRDRLQKNIKKLTFEREIWNSTSYSLSLKLIDENDLSLGRRIYVSERAWAKMARHFSIFLAERDSHDLNLLQDEVNPWRELGTSLNRISKQNFVVAIKNAEALFALLCETVEEFTKKFVYIDFAGGRRTKEPDIVSQDDLMDKIDLIKLKLDMFLHSFDSSESTTGKCVKMIKEMSKRLNNWTDRAVEIYSRHRSASDEKYVQHHVMTSLNEKVLNFHEQMMMIVLGDNGINMRASSVNSGLNIIKTRVSQASDFSEKLWLGVVDQLDGFSGTFSDIIQFIGNMRGVEGDIKQIDAVETISEVTRWLKSTVDGIDGENGKLSGLIDTLSNDQLKWMSSSLVELVPDKSNNILLREITNPTEGTLETLIRDQPELSERCLDFTGYLEKCVIGLVLEASRDLPCAQSSDDLTGVTSTSESSLVTNTLLDQLNTFKEESEEWERSAEFMTEALQKVLEKNKRHQSRTQTLDKKGKLATIDFDFDEAEAHFARDLYIIGDNDNITNRDVDRPFEEILSGPKTEESNNTLTTLTTVELLQKELLQAEEGKTKAENRIEDLEEQVRTLTHALTAGKNRVQEKLPEPKVVKPTPTLTLEPKKPRSPIRNPERTGSNESDRPESSRSTSSRPGSTASTTKKGKRSKKK